MSFIKLTLCEKEQHRHISGYFNSDEIGAIYEAYDCYGVPYSCVDLRSGGTVKVEESPEKIMRLIKEAEKQ